MRLTLLVKFLADVSAVAFDLPILNELTALDRKGRRRRQLLGHAGGQAVDIHGHRAGEEQADGIGRFHHG